MAVQRLAESMNKLSLGDTQTPVMRGGFADGAHQLRQLSPLSPNKMSMP